MFALGVDSFKGACDLGGAVLGIATPAACGAACDAVEGCRAFSHLGTACYLKECADSPFALDGAAPPAVAGATSGTRVNASSCDAFRGAVQPAVDFARPPAWLREWQRLHGRETFLTHVRAWDDAEKYAPLVSVRGERHSGTNWVRVMLNKNCPRMPHRLSATLDCDGAYGWKHDLVPAHFDARSGDRMVVVLRNAAQWLPKMKRTSYNAQLDKLGKKQSIKAFLETKFTDNYSGLKFEGVLAMRARKYAQYAERARTHANLIAVRYEDLSFENTTHTHTSAESGGGFETRAYYKCCWQILHLKPRRTQRLACSSLLSLSLSLPPSLSLSLSLSRGLTGDVQTA